MRVRLLALLCAMTLTIIPSALFGAQAAHAAAPARFYGVADSLMLTATDTATSTALTATDTPSASATNTPVATDTPT
ncbi:MAG TPA: hypothetical protein VFU60_13930, partial [Ktedonobacterales bacterium]|nr:hypothetical protein [Ktedonobacterales bacterium]